MSRRVGYSRVKGSRPKFGVFYKNRVMSIKDRDFTGELGPWRLRTRKSSREEAEQVAAKLSSVRWIGATHVLGPGETLP